MLRYFTLSTLCWSATKVLNCSFYFILSYVRAALFSNFAEIIFRETMQNMRYKCVISNLVDMSIVSCCLS